MHCGICDITVMMAWATGYLTCAVQVAMPCTVASGSPHAVMCSAVAIGVVVLGAVVLGVVTLGAVGRHLK